MRLLLDTHAFLWFCQGSVRLSATAKNAIQDASNECFVSHSSAWEIAIKVSLNKLQLDVPYEVLFPTSVVLNGFHVLEQRIEHYQALISLPFHHRDPFDRILIAQSLQDGLTIVTCDPHFSDYNVPTLW